MLHLSASDEDTRVTSALGGESQGIRLEEDEAREGEDVDFVRRFVCVGCDAAVHETDWASSR